LASFTERGRSSFSTTPPESPGGGGAAGDGGPIGCAAELYAAALASHAERSLGIAGSQHHRDGDDHPLGFTAHGVSTASLLSSVWPFNGDADAENVDYGGPPDSVSSANAFTFDDLFNAPPSPAGVGGAYMQDVGTLETVTSEMLPSSSPRPSMSVEETEREWLDGLAKQPFVETVCGCRSDGGGGTACFGALRKLGSPVIAAPPPELVDRLLGWRDPFVFADELPGTSERCWRMLLGTGIKGVGGAALIYTSFAADGTTGWSFTGVLCDASMQQQQQCALDSATCVGVGAMWECPCLLLFNSVQDGARKKAMLCVSPDRPTNRVVYWVGSYDSGTATFDLETSSGPHALDGGDVLYAPQIFTDGGGKPPRPVLFGWLQERDAARVKAAGVPDGSGLAGHDGRTTFGGIAFNSAQEAAAALHVAAAAGYSGCLTVPRELALCAATGRVKQRPIAEVTTLRRRLLGRVEAVSHAIASPDAPLELVVTSSVMPAFQAVRRMVPSLLRSCADGDGIVAPPAALDAMDVEATFIRGTSTAVGFWRPPATEHGSGLLLLWVWRDPSSTRGAFPHRDGGLLAVHEQTLSAALATAENAITGSGPGASSLPGTPPPSPSSSSRTLCGEDGSKYAVCAALALCKLEIADSEDEVRVRILYDGSAVEAFTCEGGQCPGRALATRIYRGDAAGGAGRAVELSLVALGGASRCISASAWTMASCWGQMS